MTTGAGRGTMESGAVTEFSDVALIGVVPEVYRTLYELTCQPGVIENWRYSGVWPSYEEFVDRLWRDVFIQYCVVSRTRAELIGLVQCFSANFRHGTAQFGLVFTPGVHASGLPLIAASLFLDQLVLKFGFRKLYAEVPERNYHHFASGVGRYFVHEGTLVNHEFFEGDYADTHLIAVHADEWRRSSPTMSSIDAQGIPDPGGINE